MHSLFSMLTGAGAMYLLDPERGRARRARLRDKYVAMKNDLQEACDALSRDASNRMDGLREGDYSVLVGGKNALANPFRGGWSPTGRALLAGLGGGLFLFGLASRTPKACLLGTAGLAMVAEGITNAGLDDIRELPHRLSEMTTELNANRRSANADIEREVVVSEGPSDFPM